MSRFPPARFPVDKKKAEATEKALDKEAGNALWRVPDWFKDVDAKLLSQYQIYHSELLKFNMRLNLISRGTERDADEVHFADCILASRILPRTTLGKEVYDLGSGNGLPGIVLALNYPETQFLLVEGDSRKCEFLKHIIHVLQIGNAKPMNVRLETLKNHSIEVAMSRGFASLSKSLLMVNRCFQKGGRFYHMKGGSWSSEIAEIPSQLISVWRPELVGEYSLPVSQARRAIICTTKVQDKE